MKLLDSIVTEAASIVALRRDIHAHPELCFEEVRTSDLVAAKLTEWAFRAPGLGGTGGGHRPERQFPARDRIAGRHGRPAHAGVQHLRACQHAGKMHACGHDGHVAMLLVAARHFAKHRISTAPST